MNSLSKEETAEVLEIMDRNISNIRKDGVCQRIHDEVMHRALTHDFGDLMSE